MAQHILPNAMLGRQRAAEGIHQVVNQSIHQRLIGKQVGIVGAGVRNVVVQIAIAHMPKRHNFAQRKGVA
mgnify:CR=1 FL=1